MRACLLIVAILPGKATEPAVSVLRFGVEGLVARRVRFERA
jgi:hypothetical protein